jgi:hypothetical protein
MAANTPERNIQIWEDRAEVTRDQRHEKDADRPASVGTDLGADGHVPYEQKNPDQTVLRSLNTLLPEECQYAPIDQEGKAKSENKRDDGPLPLRLIYAVHRIP